MYLCTGSRGHNEDKNQALSRRTGLGICAPELPGTSSCFCRGMVIHISVNDTYVFNGLMKVIEKHIQTQEKLMVIRWL
jgi:hypothetical protein